MGTIFKFKEFEVDQADCAMKINTDGVLLAASARDLDVSRILDIGTGTGVIALMLAQANPQASIVAVEIDEQAAKRAQSNFAHSPFSERLNAVHMDFMQLQPTDSFDLIISNPPFYTNSLHNPDGRKKLAKHTDSQFFENMLSFATQYLSEEGLLQLIVPTELAQEISSSMIDRYHLHLVNEWNISSFENENPIRTILRIGKSKGEKTTASFYIYEQKNEYSGRYKELLKPYFLAF
ncbi:tRNA1(Val) (adenine(37)-N6)-methyltransferase [Sphingobacterium hungaricum]|uniref:tRNA1(Val) (adenine(37)-N6)-methyltransferase n=1 Tax=Sphingobacterium hungaricum TaxID=2082723 RepID=A0A928UYF1_9SPHI|nr:methyltransferase [Sphingobacterium hungaricum]MBE8713394.1 tRNA methyltransferase [Sphingobacterium hungaricum]